MRITWMSAATSSALLLVGNRTPSRRLTQQHWASAQRRSLYSTPGEPEDVVAVTNQTATLVSSSEALMDDKRQQQQQQQPPPKAATVDPDTHSLPLDAPAEEERKGQILSSSPMDMDDSNDDRVASIPVGSVFLLNLVAILWGSQHAIIKTVVEDSDPSVFTLVRFSLAALLAAPYTPGLFGNKNGNKNGNESHDAWAINEAPLTNNTTVVNQSAITAWRWGLEMGFWMFLGFAFQAIGLEYTTAQKSGFLLYLNVKLVPFFAFLGLGRTISPATWASALTAFGGTALLATAGMATETMWNVGDLWSIAAAAASAMFILRLETASQRVPNAAQLNAACLWVVAGLAALWSSAVSIDEILATFTSHPLQVLYLGGVATALTNWIQSKAQQNISAERASVIYAMDPVYGALFSYWLLGEKLNGPQAWVGAGLITLAAATNAFLDFSADDSTASSSPETTNE